MGSRTAGHSIPRYECVVSSLDRLRIYCESQRPRAWYSRSAVLPRKAQLQRRHRILKPKRRPWAWAWRFWYRQRRTP